MEKVCIDDIKLSREISTTEHSGIFNKFDNEVLKLFCPEYIDLLSDKGLDLEGKIFNSSSVDNFSEIVVPRKCVYSGVGDFMGYTMPLLDYFTYEDFCNSRFMYVKNIACDLSIYCNEFGVLEDIVRRSDDVVFSDLLDSSNIMYDGERFYFIDYDGIQYNGYLSDLCVLNYDKYAGTKYVSGKFFTKEFDIKQLFYLYFNVVFGYDLSRFDSVSQDLSGFIDSEFNSFGLDCDEIKDKVLKLYGDNSNSYLGETAYRISQLYDLKVIDDHGYVKRLVRK